MTQTQKSMTTKGADRTQSSSVKQNSGTVTKGSLILSMMHTGKAAEKMSALSNQLFKTQGAYQDDDVSHAPDIH